MLLFDDCIRIILFLHARYSRLLEDVILKRGHKLTKRSLFFGTKNIVNINVSKRIRL